MDPYVEEDCDGPGDEAGHTPVNYYYDAWNRLVAVKYSLPGQPGGKPRVEFEYNGLNWRTVKRGNTTPSTPYLDQHRIMYYSADWQLLEEHIYEWGGGGPGGSPDFYIDRHMQYVWGLRYIDDIVLRQQDSNASGTFDTGWYHCTDTLFSTVAVLDDAANLVERISYDAYGMARHHHAADIDGDGAVTQDDYDLVTANLGNFGVGDINRSGTADSRDQANANDSKAALPRGEISKTDNIVGYAGYLFNAEIHGAGMYTVRHRHYAPDLGRWLTRDPIGYVDGMNLYEYVRGRPVSHLDAHGLNAGPILFPPPRWNVSPLEPWIDNDSSCTKDWMQDCEHNDFFKMAVERYRASCYAKGGITIKCDNTLSGNAKWCCRSREIYLHPSRATCGSLAHELIHAADQCDDNVCQDTSNGCGWFGRDRDGCRKRMCTEARAFGHATCCDSKSPWRTSRTWSECVKAARDSYVSKNVSRCPQTELELKREWDACLPKSGCCGKELPPQP